MSRPVLLVDGNNLLVRAVEATRRAAMTTDDGIDTSALVVFIKTLARHIREEVPYGVVVCWDAGHDAATRLLPSYKANRTSGSDTYRRQSQQLAVAFCALAGVLQARVAGVEADHLIATYWRNATGPITILSSDKDMLQLVGLTPTEHPCEQIRLSSYGTPTDRWNTARVIEHFGCTPEQLPLAMALAGDTSDNVPGVPGIGMKRAVKHLAEAAWELDKITHEGIRAHREQVEVYRQIVDLRNGYDLQDSIPSVSLFMPVGPGDPSWPPLAAFLKKLQLTDITRRLIEGYLW